MTTQRNADSEPTRSAASPSRWLLSWPFALLATSAVLFLVANTVSAWGGRESDRAEHFKEHAEHFVDRMLDRIDASDDQAAQVQQIVGATIDELADLHESRADLREEVSALLTAERVDREAIETLRSSQLARADEMSRIVTASLADVMDILTVQQRRELEERMSRHHGRHGRRWH